MTNDNSSAPIFAALIEDTGEGWGYIDDTPEYEISSDDDFAAAVRGAIAASRRLGHPVGIRWQRSADGQTAYWGPGGATFSPYGWEG